MRLSFDFLRLMAVFFRSEEPITSTSGQNRGVSCLADQNTQKEVVVECFAPYDDHK
jgi:hypothetical protein